MKQEFKYLDGIITIETVNGRTTATMTDADGNVTDLAEVESPEASTAGDLTPEQIAAISQRFGNANKDGQPF